MTMKHYGIFGILVYGLLFGLEAYGIDLNDSAHLPFGGYYCWLRCIGKCLESDSSRSLNQCGQQCQSYSDDQLCSNSTCWLTCNDLIDGVQSGPSSPNLTVSYGSGSYDPYNANLNWTSVSDAQLYVVQYRDSSDVFTTWSTGRSGAAETKALTYQYRKPLLCPEFQFRVAAVNSRGVSQFSDIQTLEAPTPAFPSDATYGLVRQIWYTEDPWYDITGDERDNTTLYADVNFTMPDYWSPRNFSDADLIFSVLQCTKPDMSRAYPTPIHVRRKYYTQLENLQRAPCKLDKASPVVHVKIPGSIMRQKCFAAIRLESIETVCNTKAKFPSHIISTNINCDTVEYSPCNLPVEKKQPVCTLDQFSCTIPESGEPCYLARLPENTTTTINISWKMTEREMANKGDPLFWAVRWGPGSRPDTETGKIFGIVKMTSIEQTLRSCDANKVCSLNRSMELDEIPVGQLLGVQICAVFEEGLEFYNREIAMLSTRPIEIQVKIDDDDESTSPGLLALAICIPLGIAFTVFLCVLCCLYRRHKDQTEKFEQMQYQMSQMENEERYTNLPRKHDIWELERRNLILYDDKKLGSGAFGSVFMGKIAGKVLGPKDSTSALATNLMRVENADVAVKMLPEYADELSKADFLKEINLMKQLGYHERLVNMMACITDTEPYCLIVEYCSHGDLLHFLRDRCKYMMKLDEQGIDYTSPEPDDVIDPNFVLSLKQLLGFAVQCSVGLEYLSQKGFIHRDVAARNVLVHEGKYAKIGDFGLCRFVYGNDTAYWGKGGRLPIKWMSPEAIKSYEFTSKSDIWSFGVLLFEIITMGGCPYPGIQPADVEAFLEGGGRMDKPDNCPDQYYSVMMDCWQLEPERRLDFSQAKEGLAKMLEETVLDYSYLSLNQQRDYYNVPYSEQEVLVTADPLPEQNLDLVTLGFDNRAFEPIEEESSHFPDSGGYLGQTIIELDDGDVTESPNTRIADRHDSGLDLGADSVSVSSAEVETPGGTTVAPPVPPRRLHLDSASSDRFLITPTEEKPINKFRFSFKNGHDQSGLTKVPEDSTGSTNYNYSDSGLSSAVSNDSYSEFLIRNPPPAPPPRRGV